MMRKFKVDLEIEIRNMAKVQIEGHNKRYTRAGIHRWPQLNEAIKLIFEQASDNIDVQKVTIQSLERST